MKWFPGLPNPLVHLAAPQDEAAHPPMFDGWLPCCHPLVVYTRLLYTLSCCVHSLVVYTLLFL